MSGQDELQSLVDTVALTTGAPVTLEDRDLNLVASSGHDDVIDDVRRTSILRRRSSADVQQLFGAFGIARAEVPLRIPGDPQVGRLSRWCIPVRWRKVTYGYLWLLDPEAIVPADVVEGLGDVVAQVAASMALRARAAHRTSWAVGELLTSDSGVRARAAEELGRDGLLPTSGHLVVVALAPRGGGPVGPVNSWLLPRTVLNAPVGQRAALVMPEAEGWKGADIAERAARSLVAQHPRGVAAGVSGPVTARDGHVGWRQADAALSVALRRDLDAHHDVTVQDWADLGVLRLLAFGDPALLTATLADQRAWRLLDGDPDLVLTARTYLDQAGSAQRAAADLAIHRQTLYQRLRRIADLTGYDLENGRDRLALHLILALADLRG